MDHDRAIREYVDANPDLEPAYLGWKDSDGSYDWVELLFPGSEDRDDPRLYVLLNACYAIWFGPVERMTFAFDKLKPASLSRQDTRRLDVIRFYSQLSLGELQRLGI